MKEKVIWGTGWIAAKYVGTLRHNDISFFIDSDIEKKGKTFLGRPVKMPDEIKSWDNIVIYIQINFYEEIAELLRKKNLVEGRDFLKYDEPKLIEIDDIDQDCDSVYEFLRSDKSLGGKIWCWGSLLGFHKSYNIFYKKLYESLHEEYTVISDAVYINQLESAERSGSSVYVLPKIFAADMLRPIVRKENADYSVILQEKYPELMEIAKEYEGIYSDLENGEAHLFTYKQASFIEKMLLSFRPKGVIILCSFPTSHRILAVLCKKQGIPVIYTHKGALPKTWALEIGGGMGESLPAVYSDVFKMLPVNADEMEEAKDVWKYLNESRINRKIQPQNNWKSRVCYRIKKNRPIIFYAGLNDTQSGLAYYGENARIYHSPMFSSSMEAVPFLADLAKKNDWNLLYKPHPMYRPTEEQKNSFPDNVIYVDAADINDVIDFSDVTITILSSTAYVALIRKKPVVMLGYNQLRRKDCTYEAFTKDNIDFAISSAINEGFSQKQQDAFTKHIAQLLKYYLYADLEVGAVTFGKPLPKNINDVYELSELVCGKSCLLTEREAD